MGSHLFGEHLKREREMRNVSLEEISAATRISVRFLEALENEQWERLPGGVFNRGFIRSVAKFLGLDEEGLIAEYAMETRERPEIAVWTKEPVHPRPNWLGILGSILALILLIAGGWFIHARYGPAISSWHEAHPVIKTILDKLHRQKTSSSGESSGTAAAEVRQPAVQLPITNTPNAGASSNEPQSSGSAANRTVSAPSNQPASDTQLELKVEAGETSTVTVIADGKSVFSGRLEALRSLSFHAQKSFTVTSSKSSAVLLELNGHTVPPLGPPGEPGKITLTRENLSAGPGGEY
ncbi:MAG TPA: RodZ domain-containing protein [Candidatus Acidoferrales bacterium]|nr:RodZ domain-containing protein [Candidatus Acidoferrales bacterium]